MAREIVFQSPTPQCCRYWKGSLHVALNFGRQLYLLYLYQKCLDMLFKRIYQIKKLDFALLKASPPYTHTNTHTRIYYIYIYIYVYMCVCVCVLVLVSVLCLMTYQPSWLIWFHSRLTRITLVVLLNHLFVKITEFMPFTKGINSKMNVIARLKHELSCYNVQHISHYATGTLPLFAQSAGAVEYTDCFSAEG